MVLKADHQRVKTLIKDALTLLCKDGLQYRSEFCIEALIGITLDQEDVMLVSINETFQDGDVRCTNVHTSDAPSPITSDSSDSCHRTKDHRSPNSLKPHAESYDRSFCDSGMLSSCQTGSKSPANVRSKHDRDSSCEREGLTGFDEPRKKRCRRNSKKSVPSSQSLAAVKLEGCLPDGCSFIVTTGATEPSDQAEGTTLLCQDDPVDDSGDVAIKDEVVLDSKLEDTGSCLGQPADIHGDGQSGADPGFPTDQMGIRTTPGHSGEIQSLGATMHVSTQGKPEEGAMSQSFGLSTVPPLHELSTSGQTPPGTPTKTYDPSQPKDTPGQHGKLQCIQCSRTFVKKRGLIEHTKAYHLGQEFICTICNKVFKSQSGLRNHQKQHLGNEPYTCKYCDKKFTYKSDYKGHVSRHQNSKKYQCDKCLAKFRWPSNFASHREVCGRDDKQYKCLKCTKVFKLKRYLTEHLKAHDGKKTHQCQVCGALFSHRSSLHRHVMKHVKKHNM